MQSLLKALPVLKHQTNCSSNILNLRCFTSVSSQMNSLFASNKSAPQPLLPMIQPQQHRNFHLLLPKTNSKLLEKPKLQLKLDIADQQRTVTKFSMKKGRRKTVKCIPRRYYRLDWGIWIRPISGRHRHLWRKGKLRRKRIRNHVFVNTWHNKVLERMTTKFWKKKKYYVDDPYESYHTRPDFAVTKGDKNSDHWLRR